MELRFVSLRKEARRTALCPVVTRAVLAEDEVVWPEHVADGTAANGVHGTGLEVDEHGAGNVLVGTGLVVVDGDTLKLEVVVSLVVAIVVETVLVRDDLPELHTYRQRKSAQREDTCEAPSIPIWLPHYKDCLSTFSMPDSCLDIPGRSGGERFHAC